MKEVLISMIIMEEKRICVEANLYYLTWTDFIDYVVLVKGYGLG